MSGWKVTSESLGLDLDDLKEKMSCKRMKEIMLACLRIQMITCFEE
jgi:hypothetical protein